MTTGVCAGWYLLECVGLDRDVIVVIVCSIYGVAVVFVACVVVAVAVV